MNIYKKIAMLPIVALLLATPTTIKPAYSISENKFNDLKSRYYQITSVSPIDSNIAKEFIRDLLSETWTVGSEESTQMTQWIEKLGSSTNIDIRPLMPDKYEVTRDISSAVIETLKKMAISGSMSAFFTVLPMILPLLGGNFSIEMITAIGNSFVLGAATKGLHSFAITSLQTAQDSHTDRPSMHTESLISFLSNQHIRPSGPTPVPAIIQSLPYIGEELQGAIVPGWVNFIIGASGSIATGYAVHKLQRSPWIYKQYDAMVEKARTARENISHLFNQGMKKVKQAITNPASLLPDLSIGEINDFEFTEDDLTF